MKDINLISIEDLKEACKQVNASGVAPKRLKVVGVSKHDLVKAFAYAIEKTPDEDVKKLPKIAKELYKDIFKDEIEKEAASTKPEKVAKKSAQAKKAAPEKKAEKKEKVLKDVDEWGAAEGKQTFIINDMLRTGGSTIDEIATACNTKKSRVRNHFNYLKTKFGVVIVCNEHKYYIKKEAKSGSKKG